MLMMSSYNPKYTAFTYIEVAFLLCSLFLIIQGMTYFKIVITKQDYHYTLQKQLFLLSNTIAQSLIPTNVNQAYQTCFRQENISPFHSESSSLSTLPMSVIDFATIFHTSLPGSNCHDKTKIVCFQKKRMETSPPTYQYVVYAYQEQNNEVVYGFSSFCQHE